MGAEIGNPFKHFAVLFLLDGVIAVADIGVVQGNCPAHRFRVVAAPSAGTGVNPETGIPVEQRIPEGIVTLNMQVFQNSVTIFLCVFLPVGHRRKIEILAIDPDTVLPDQFVDSVRDPCKCTGIPQIQETVLTQPFVFACVVQQKVRVLQINFRADKHTFRFKPDEQIDVVCRAVIGDRFHGVRKMFRIAYP